MKTPPRRPLLPFLALLFALVAAPTLWGQDERGYDTPYYPLKVGNTWTYRAGEQRVVVKVEKKDTIIRQRRNEKDKAVKERLAAYTLRITSGDKTMTEQVAVLGDGVYRFQAAGKAIEPPVRFFKLPLDKGERWEINSTSEGTPLKGSFEAGEERTTVPAGEFQTMKVSSPNFQLGPQAMELTYWFAPRVGMVRQKLKVGNFETELQLEKFEPAAGQ